MNEPLSDRTLSNLLLFLSRASCMGPNEAAAMVECHNALQNEIKRRAEKRIANTFDEKTTATTS